MAAVVALMSLMSLMSLSACGLQGGFSDIGRNCIDAGDCDAETLGCVLVDEEAPTGDRICFPPPEEWTCTGKFFGDGACDCGCGLVDLDCPNALGSSCASDGNKCPAGQEPVAADNTSCQ